MKIELRTWPFALRRLCGKWYMLALVFFAALSAIACSIIYNDDILMISSVLGILVIYGGAVAVASYYGTHERLGLVEQSLWEIGGDRIGV